MVLVTESKVFNATNTDNLVINSNTDVIVFSGGSNSPNFQLTGIAGGVDGRQILLLNVSGFALFIPDSDSRSNPTNQFFGSASIDGGAKARTIIYRGGLLNRWVFVIDR